MRRPVRSGRRRYRAGGRYFAEEANEPLAGMANLVDLMLVFACGLMIAVFLSLDLMDLLQMPPEERAAALEALQNAQELESMETQTQDVTQSQIESAGQYESVGTVYRDTITGRMFVIEGGR